MTFPHVSRKLSDVFAYVEQYRQPFIQRLMDYVRRPSISAYGEGIEKVADYLVTWLNQLGFHTRRVPTAGWPFPAPTTT